MIVSELQGVRLAYVTSVTFTTLKSSDSGSYVCSANVSPQPSMSGQIVESSRDRSINIAVGGCMAYVQYRELFYTIGLQMDFCACE